MYCIGIQIEEIIRDKIKKIILHSKQKIKKNTVHEKSTEY